MATFTFRTPGTPDGATGHFTGASETAYTGQAVQVSGSADEYRRLREAGVAETEAVVLLWTPATYAEGSLPPLGSTIAWAGRTLALVAHLKVVAHDGVPIFARLGCRR